VRVVIGPPGGVLVERSIQDVQYPKILMTAWVQSGTFTMVATIDTEALDRPLRERSIDRIDAEGATAPETLRQKDRKGTILSGERRARARRRDNALRHRDRGGTICTAARPDAGELPHALGSHSRLL
jgi:hypothetical protein